MPRRLAVQLLTSRTTLSIMFIEIFFSYSDDYVQKQISYVLWSFSFLTQWLKFDHKAPTLGWFLPCVCLLSPQYSSSRPSSTETARLGSRTNSMSSHTRPERDLRPLSLRYSSPQHSSYLKPIETSVLSQIYSTPYSPLHHGSPQRLEKAPLVKVIQSDV